MKVEKLKNESVASMITVSEESRRMADMMKMYSSAFCRIFCLKRLKRGRGLGIVVGDHLRRGDIMQRIAKFEKSKL